MWIETIEGFIINSDTLEKIEIKYPNIEESPPRAGPIRITLKEKDISAEEFEELRKEMEALGIPKVSEEPENREEPEDKEESEVICEIHAWSAREKEDPYILFRGEKEDCESEFSDLKQKLGTH